MAAATMDQAEVRLEFRKLPQENRLTLGDRHPEPAG